MKKSFITKLETNNYLIGSFDSYIEESKELFDKIGMNNTFVNIPKEKIDMVANGNYDGRYFKDGNYIIRENANLGVSTDDKARILGQPVGNLSGHAGLFSNVSDMTKLARAIIDNKVLNLKIRDIMSQNRTGFAFQTPENGTRYRQYFGMLVYLKNPDLEGSEIPHILSGKTFASAGWTGTQQTIDPVNNINLTINKGINVIIGENGSGKTTLLDLIANEITPTKGEILVNSKKIGYAKENLDYTETLYDELMNNLYLSKLKNYEKRINDVLLMVNLDSSVLDKKIKTLTQSEIKKASIAISLICNPDILILDNPSNNLDKEAKDNLIKLIKLLKNRYNKTIVIASNDLEFVHKIADKIYVLYNKKIVLEGNKYGVFTSNLKKYNLDKPNIIKFEELVQNKKNIKLGFRDEINDLIKDIYRNTY